MRRKIYERLKEWKADENGQCAILIEGARRIGKSYIAEEFGKEEYNEYLLIDFSKDTGEIAGWFDEYMDDLDTLFSNLRFRFNKKLKPRAAENSPANTLIILDEVQFCPRARAAIKHLVADHRFDYIETGSLISIKKNVKGIMIPSEEYAIQMYPMDFEEFLWAKGEDQAMPYIHQHFESLKEVGQGNHRKLIRLFREYALVGGMPQVVKKYIETGEFKGVEREKRKILQLYRNDIKKYADGQEVNVSAIFEEIPGQLQQKMKKFRISSLKANARMRDYDHAFFWLTDAFIINCCYNSAEPNVGLHLNRQRSLLKCYMGDTGLLISMAFDENESGMEKIYHKLMLDKLEVNEGMIVENIVSQMLVAAGHKLYFYYTSDREEAANRMEIDFLLRKRSVTSRHNIIPIEVKSGTRYTISSLKKYMAKYDKYVDRAYVIHDKDLKVENGIVYLPYYMVPLL